MVLSDISAVTKYLLVEVNISVSQYQISADIDNIGISEIG